MHLYVVVLFAMGKNFEQTMFILHLKFCRERKEREERVLCVCVFAKERRLKANNFRFFFFFNDLMI